MSSTRSQSQLCIGTPISSFVQCHASFRFISFHIYIHIYIYILPWKQYALPLITTMALWQLMQLRFESSVCRGSLMTTYIYIYIYIQFSKPSLNEQRCANSWARLKCKLTIWYLHCKFFWFRSCDPFTVRYYPVPVGRSRWKIWYSKR